MTKYKVVRYKDFGNWFVFERYLLFFWRQVNYFKNFESAADYALTHNNNDYFTVEVGKENIPKPLQKRISKNNMCKHD